MRPKISFGFCAMACVMAWIDLRFALWFLLSVLCHEMGHLLAMKCCGVQARGISLSLGGAVIQAGEMGNLQELICACGGPATSILLGAAMLRSCPELALVSLLLGGVNLVPIYPMDGGRILRSILMRCCWKHAALILRITAYGTAAIFMVLACWVTAWRQSGVWPIFAALVLLWRAGDGEKELLFSCAEDRINK